MGIHQGLSKQPNMIIEESFTQRHKKSHTSNYVFCFFGKGKGSDFP